MDGHAASNLGAMLRQHRLRAHLSQLELAHRAGISVDAVAALERGRRRSPRPYTVRALTEALGLTSEERAEFVEAAGAAEDPPAAVEVPKRPHTAIIGRDRDLDAVCALLTTGESRAVSLVGPGGVGKSRLALELMSRLGDAFEDGIGWVPLATVSDAGAVPGVVAAGVGVRQTPGRSVAESLQEQLGDRHQLVVLDNCEHLLPAAASMVRALLDAGPRLRILLTSRQRVSVPGERVWPVRPLTVPPSDSTLEALDDFSATTLFLERARALDPEFTVAPADTGRVARLLGRLDGLPLALELAAARTNVLTVAELADGIEASLSVLGAGASSVPSRQRTLQGAIDWSFQLLSPAEQSLLVRLVVFHGGATREAIEAVCVGEDLPADQLLDLLDSLSAKSLVVPRAMDGRTRYFLLRTIRQFLLDQHNAADEATAGRHARYYRDFAERAAPQLRPTAEPDWLAGLDAEAANLRRAVTWSLDGGDVDAGVRLAGALWPWCHLRGVYGEGRGWVECALTVGSDAPTPQRARVLAGAAMMAFLQCEYDVARARVEQCRELFVELGDRAGVAWAMERLGSIARELGEYDAAAAHHHASETIFREIGDLVGAGRALSYLGFVAWLCGDLDAAERYCDDSLRLLTAVGEHEGMAWALLSRGVVGLYRNDLGGAASLLTQSLELSSELSYREGVAWSLNQLGVLARRRGDLDSARDLLEESLELHRALGDLWRVASVIEELAAVAVGRGEPAAAAHLLGAADAVRTRIGTPVPACEQQEHQATDGVVRAALTDAMYESARWAGATAPLEHVVRR